MFFRSVATCVIAAIIAGANALSGQTHVTNSKSPVIRPMGGNEVSWNYGVQLSGGVGLKDRSDFSFLNAGVHAGKILYTFIDNDAFRANFEYGVEVIPYWQSFTPKFQRITCPAGATSATQCSTPYTVGGTFTGVSVTPIVLRVNLTSEGKFVPWIQGAGGVLYTSRKYPAIGNLNYADPTMTGFAANTSQINFTPQFGIGTHYFVKPQRSVDFGANAVHISSASLGDKNPGVNIQRAVPPSGIAGGSRVMSSEAEGQDSTAAIVECVPNFSEGNDRDKVVEIVRAMRIDGVHLLDWSMDADHNRSVVTVAGAPEAVCEAAVRGAGKAAELIDLTRQSGAHPRIGAADVVPFVPVSGLSLVQCAMLARQAGMALWRRYGVPVYFYEGAALRPDRVNLETVRRGQFEGLSRDTLRDSTRRPDVGGPELHATAGASAVGARNFLIAYNLYLAGSDRLDVGVARTIAREVRASSGGLLGVKAMGVMANGRVQVSMNITDFHRTPMTRVYEAVAGFAERHGAKVAEGELIGLIPEAAYEPNAAWVRQTPQFDPEQRILERRLKRPIEWP